MNGNKQNGEKVTHRDRWVRDRFQEYISQEGREDAYLRGLHYFIVSTYAEDNPIRWLPCRAPTKNAIKLAKKANIPIEELYKQHEDGSWTRLYRNTLNEYKNLSDYVVIVRMKGLIPWSLLQDHKNDEITQGCWDRKEAVLNSVYGTNAGEFDFTFDKMDDWEEYKSSIYLSISRPHFNHQDKRLIVIVEKSKNKGEIERLCRKNGADFIQFGGQHSVTRLQQLTKLAKAENKAMRIFHLTDLDIAGWNMPKAILKRIQEIYPNPEHESIRVCLTRKQANAWNLPESFDPIKDKAYKDGSLKKFEKETGSISCIELDGVPRKLLIATIIDALAKYSGIDEDNKEYKETEEKYNNRYTEIKEEFFEDLDSIDSSIDYQAKVDRFNEIIDEIKDTIESYFDEMEELKQSLSEIESDIEEGIKKKLLEGDESDSED
jgi:hypothetical protein